MLVMETLESCTIKCFVSIGACMGQVMHHSGIWGHVNTGTPLAAFAVGASHYDEVKLPVDI